MAIGSREAYLSAIREAHEAAWALKWEAAELKYREALTQLPGDPTALLGLAVALARTGRLEEALEEYLQARQALPRDTLVAARVADLHTRLGHSELAVRAYLDLAALRVAQEDQARAVEALVAALEGARGSRRLILAVEAAAIRAGAHDLASQIEAALAEAPLEEPLADPAASVPASLPDGPTPTAEAASAEPAKPVPQPAVRQPAARTLSARVEQRSDPLVLAHEHARAGRRAAAAAEYLRAADILPGEQSVAARRLAGNVCRDWLIGEIDEVATLTVADRPIVLDAMAACHADRSKGLLRAALDDGLRAISAGPEYLPAQLALADIHRDTGLVGDALARVEVVADLYEHRREHRRAAAALRRLGAWNPSLIPWARVVDDDRAASDLDQAAEDLFGWSEQLNAQGDSAGALERQREAVQASPSARHFMRHGTFLEQRGQLEAALAAFDSARRLAPSEEIIAAAQTRCQAVLGRWDELEACLEPLIASLPNDPVLADEVVPRYRAALYHNPDLPGLQFCLGRALGALGQAEEAADWLGRAGADGGRVGRLAYLNLGRAELEAGRPAQAIAHFRRVVDFAAAGTQQDRNLTVAAGHLLADASLKAGDWSGAAVALDALVAAAPQDESLYARLAEAHLKTGAVGDAMTALSRLADLYLSRSDAERAQAIYSGMLQLAPEHPLPHEKLGQLHLAADRREEALAELEKAAALEAARGSTRAAEADYRAVLALCRPGDTARALSVRERLAAICPGDVALRRELISGYLKAGRSVQAMTEARALADQLLAADHPAQLAEAETAVRQVIQLDPWNLEGQLELGNLLVRLGRAEEAAAVFERVLAQDPANQTAGRALRLLTSGGLAREQGGTGGSGS